METGLLDEIYINFLIVGHTHISIDQYFSVLSRAINRAEFIVERIFLDKSALYQIVRFFLFRNS